MRLLEDLFVGAGVTDLETVVYSLRRQIPVLRLWCVVFFEDRQRMELLSSAELFRPRNAARPAIIAGVAMGRREAMELTAFMAAEAQKHGRSGADPKQWMETDGEEG